MLCAMAGQPASQPASQQDGQVSWQKTEHYTFSLLMQVKNTFFTNTMCSLTSLSSAHTLLKASIQRFLAGDVSWKVCCSGSNISKELSTYSWVLCRLTLEEDTRLLAGLVEDTRTTSLKSKQCRKRWLYKHSILPFFSSIKKKKNLTTDHQFLFQLKCIPAQTVKIKSVFRKHLTVTNNDDAKHALQQIRA